MLFILIVSVVVSFVCISMSSGFLAHGSESLANWFGAAGMLFFALAVILSACVLIREIKHRH
jgi:hypothetical protein